MKEAIRDFLDFCGSSEGSIQGLHFHASPAEWVRDEDGKFHSSVLMRICQGGHSMKYILEIDPPPSDSGSLEMGDEE